MKDVPLPAIAWLTDLITRSKLSQFSPNEYLLIHRHIIFNIVLLLKRYFAAILLFGIQLKYLKHLWLNAFDKSCTVFCLHECLWGNYLYFYLFRIFYRMDDLWGRYPCQANYNFDIFQYLVPTISSWKSKNKNSTFLLHRS